MIGIGKSWVLAAVAASSVTGGAIGWGLSKEPEPTLLDSRGMWCRNKNLSRYENPANCLKYDSGKKYWLYGQVVYDHSKSKASDFNWKKMEQGVVFAD